MARRHRLAPTLICTLFLSMLIACGGAGNRKSDTKEKPEPQSNAQVPTKNVSQKEKAEARAKARAQAEEEARKKDEANRKAFQDEVSELKERHQKKLEQFKADQEVYKEA